MKFRKNTIISALALVLAGAVPVAASAATVDLSTSGWVTYGDGNSYALNVNGIEVLSGPGQIDVFTKLGLNPPGQLNNVPVTMDDAFRTPTANPIDGFRMSSANEPGGAAPQGSWDRAGWWDSTLSALSTNLDLLKNSMVFFFANNETGNTPDLAGWARIELTQISTNSLLGRFDLTNDPTHQGLVGYGPPPTGGGIPLGNPLAYTSNGAAPVVSDFIDSGNDVCTLNGQLVPCGTPGATLYHENLGGDRAAYAIVFPELDLLIKNLALGGADLSDYAIHVDYRLGCGPELTAAGAGTGPDGGFPLNPDGSCADNYALNGGDEKVFIGTQLLTINRVPEPSSVLLAALGLLGLGFARRRQS